MPSPINGTLVNKVDPDQTHRTDQGLHCLLTGISIQNKKVHQTRIKLERDSSNWYGWKSQLDLTVIISIPVMRSVRVAER